MKYQQYLFVLALSLCLSATAAAQQPAKVRKPVKNPPQFPNIIDLEGQQTPQQPAKQENQTVLTPPAPQSDALVRAVEMLVGEVRNLAGEMRSLNLRQQAQLDLARLTRLDLRIDHFERELKPVRERIALLDAEEQNLNQMMTRESLLAQTANIGTLDRDGTMRQIKAQHEYRLRLVQAERERLQRYEAELAKDLAAVRAAGTETERRIQQTEAQLKRDDTVPETDKRP